MKNYKLQKTLFASCSIIAMGTLAHATFSHVDYDNMMHQGNGLSHGMTYSEVSASSYMTLSKETAEQAYSTFVKVPELHTSSLPLSKMTEQSINASLEKSLTESALWKENDQWISAAYKGNKTDAKNLAKYSELREKFKNEGWKVTELNGKTGSSSNQSESLMGLIAFKGKNVKIAIRGTDSRYDLITDFRCGLGNADKLGQMAAQHLNINGSVHVGFLDAALSLYPQIKEALLAEARAQNCQAKEFKVDVTGHSLGAALGNIIQTKLLTDYDLEFGIRIIEPSNEVSVSSLYTSDESNNLGESAFFQPAKVEQKKNTQIKYRAYAEPPAYSADAVKQVNEIVGAGNHISKVAASIIPDPVVVVPGIFANLGHVGEKITVQANNVLGVLPNLLPHFMSNYETPTVEKGGYFQQAFDNVKTAAQKVVDAGKSAWNRFTSWFS